MNHERFAQSNDALLGSGNGTLEEEEVVLDNTVVGETTQRRDGLLRDVLVGGGVVILFAEANAVDLLVDLRSVVVAIYEVEVL